MNEKPATGCSLESKKSILRTLCIFPFAAVLTLATVLSMVIPVIMTVGLTVASSNSLMKDLAKKETDHNAQGLAAITTERLGTAEIIGMETAREFEFGVLNASDEAQVHFAMMSRVRSYGKMSALSIIGSDCVVHGAQQYDGVYHLYHTFPNGTVCQFPVDEVTLKPIGNADWCDFTPDSGCRGLWYTERNTSRRSDAGWTGVYQLGEPAQLFQSYSVVAFAPNGKFAGVVVVDEIFGSIERLVKGSINVSNGIVIIINTADDTIVASTDPTIKTTTRNPTTGAESAVKVASVTQEDVAEAHSDVVEAYGNWSQAAGHTFWSTGQTVVAVLPIERPGLSWAVVVIARPTLVTVPVTTLAVAVSITVVLVALALCLSWWIVRPINRLSTEMTAISELQFDNSLTKRSLSTVREIRDMQKSFLRLRAGTRALTKYISPDVVLGVMRTESCDLNLDMTMAPLTIMFTDLKGFTSMSEKLPHPVLISILNTWFREFGTTIKTHNGMIDKFIGDCIMALFGAPNPIKDSELEACRAALEFRQAMDRVNNFAMLNNVKPLEYRVGVHTGRVLVGHLGYADHVNFTVCGSTANTASRMEQLGKDYGITPLVSGAVAHRVSDEFLCVLIDVVFLRGHTVTRTAVYHLVCALNAVTPEIVAVVAVFGGIHALLRAGNVEEAIANVDHALSMPQLSAYRTALGVLKHNLHNGATDLVAYLQENCPDEEPTTPRTAK